MRRIALGLAVVLAASAAWAEDVRVDATVNADRIGVEDVLELTISISGGDADGEPELPPLEEFRVASRSTSSQIQIVNGRMSSTRSYIYQLLPQKEGLFEIGAATVRVGGTAHTTQPIPVDVRPGSLVARRPRGLGSPFDPFEGFGGRARRDLELKEDDVFVRTEIASRSVFQGEEVVVTYRLYTRFAPLGPELADDPPLTGFWVEKVDLGAEPPTERRTVEGKQYATFPLMQRVVFPTQSGTLEIPPVTFSMAFRLSSGDPFDAFFARASSPVTLRSQPISIEVAPLPSAGRSPDFKGAVGRFELQAKVSQEEMAAGDPVTLTLAIAGKGNLRSVGPPELSELKGFRAFDPKTQEKARASASGLEGEKSWEYVLVPESSGVKEIGPWRFQYFDPAEKKYVTASVGPLSMKVTGEAALAANGLGANAGSRGEVTVLREDIRFLKPPPQRLGLSSRELHESPWFYAALVLPVLWNAALLVYLRRQEKEKTHSHLFRSRRAQRMARERLKKAAKLASEGSKDFYDEVAAALYRYAGDKSGASASGLTSSSIAAVLAGRSVSEELRAEFQDVLSQCEEARFTPGPRSREEMEALRARAEKLIVAVERQWSK
ncbi:MAG TPA: BatD family protein [Vicinamibacteria bacterium]|nr:BatD family protein [Vicinamibacteria bacterium]